ncbi:MAG: hypothetical protein ABEJ42_07180 [Halobacteriaceae archaeon]
MTVGHDHPTVETLEGELGTRGPTDRPCVRLDAGDADALALESVVRVVLDGETGRGRFVDGRAGPELRAVFDTPEQVRTPGAGENRLAAWVDDHDLSEGRTVHVDVVERGERYGLRAPGQRATYRDLGSPDESLSVLAEDIAED